MVFQMLLFALGQESRNAGIIVTLLLGVVTSLPSSIKWLPQIV